MEAREGEARTVWLDLPADAVELILAQDDPTCSVRLIEGHQRKDWDEVPIFPEDSGGCSTRVAGIRRGMRFEIQTQINGSTWKSRSISLTPFVKLVKLGGNL